MRRPQLGSIVVVVMVLAGCGSATPSGVAPSPSAQPTQAPSAATAPPTPAATVAEAVTTGTLPAELVGTFAARVDPSAVPHADQAGDWFLTLTRDHGYAFGRVATGRVDNPGDLTVSGTSLMFSNETGPSPCLPPGEYTWAIQGGNLVFTKVADICTVRVKQYVAQPWIPCAAGPTTCADVLK